MFDNRISQEQINLKEYQQWLELNITVLQHIGRNLIIIIYIAHWNIIKRCSINCKL